MSELKRLMNTLCPDGVEYRKLGECIQENLGGGTPSKSKPSYWGGNIPWASVKDMVKEELYLRETQDSITEEGLKNSPSHLVPKGNIIVANRINPGKMLIAACDIAINQDLRGLILKDCLDEKFLTYYFQTLTIIGKGTTVKGISVDELEAIRIPVPPLAVQSEIVRLLDNFTALTAALTAELAARKTQYEHYRDALLTFPAPADDTALASKQASKQG